MSASQPTTQTAAARRAAEAQLRTFVEMRAPEQLRLVSALRRALRKRLPTAHEVVYEYRDCCVISLSPNERGYDGVLAIRASAEGVKLYFQRGKDLRDPTKLLQGSGSQARWVETPTASALRRPEIVALLEEAIARNRVPFARTGRGSVIIQSTLAKKRRTRSGG